VLCIANHSTTTTKQKRKKQTTTRFKMLQKSTKRFQFAFPTGPRKKADKTTCSPKNQAHVVVVLSNHPTTTKQNKQQ
jgi:hypothetical protein